MPDSPEILPPEKPAAVSPVQIGRFSIPVVVIQVVRWASVLVLLGWAGWSLQNFISLRGIVNLLASRINLLFFWLACFAAIWILTSSFRRKVSWRVLAAAVLSLCIFVLDWLAPKPAAAKPAVAVASAHPVPFITMKIHPAAFPVSVPSRTTLHILPLHPFQTFTDSASQLHEYDNWCPTDRPWPSEKEISSKSVNSYEEVRNVEITNHGPGTMESGRIVFGVRYNKSFAGGCTAPAPAQTQDDVISVPTLDQGQTFSFVSVNQTDGCAWLLPPDAMRVKMVGDDNSEDVSLKLEAINIPNWIGTPFGPTSIKWEGVPVKNPGYGIVRSGAVCEVPKARSEPNALEHEAQRMKFANREKLADLLQDNTALKNKCYSPQSAPPGFSCEAEFNAWLKRSAKVLDTIERSYKARFDATTGLNYSWPNVTDPNVEVIINTLNHKADALKEFIKEQE
jgi:hypothetical protein